MRQRKKKQRNQIPAIQTNERQLVMPKEGTSVFVSVLTDTSRIRQMLLNQYRRVGDNQPQV